MSIKSRFCVRCGKEIETTIDGLCHSCYVEDHPVQLPKQIELKICPKCNATMVKKVWINSDKTPEEYFIDEIKSKAKLPEHVKLTKMEIIEQGKLGEIKLDLSVAGTLIPIQVTMPLLINKFCCSDCSRHHSDWVAKVQVRGVEIEYLLPIASKYKNHIVRTKQQDRGIDFFFFGRSPANKLAQDISKEFGGKIVKSYEQHGHDYDIGQPKHREIILVKI